MKQKAAPDLTEDQLNIFFWLLNEELAFVGYDDDAEEFTINIICSDLFGYSCADAEKIEPSELWIIGAMFQKFGYEGIDAWCSFKRKANVIPERDTDKFYEALYFLNRQGIIGS